MPCSLGQAVGYARLTPTQAIAFLQSPYPLPLFHRFSLTGPCLTPSLASLPALPALVLVQEVAEFTARAERYVGVTSGKICWLCRGLVWTLAGLVLYRASAALPQFWPWHHLVVGCLAAKPLPPQLHAVLPALLLCVGGMDQAISIMGMPGIAKLVEFNPVSGERGALRRSGVHSYLRRMFC